MFYQSQVHNVADDGRPTADQGEPGKELPGNCQKDSPRHLQTEGEIQDETKLISFVAQGTALYELYLSIQQRALRAFHDPGTWGGLGSGDVLSMLTMAGEHLQVLINTHKALDMCSCAPLCSRNALIV